MAEACEEAVGIDVSDSMLSECLANCEAAGLSNVTLFKSDDVLSALSGSFDLVHSFIVFQHIHRSRGERMLLALLEHLGKEGIAVLHFVYQWDAGLFHDRGVRNAHIELVRHGNHNGAVLYLSPSGVRRRQGIELAPGGQVEPDTI